MWMWALKCTSSFYYTGEDEFVGKANAQSRTESRESQENAKQTLMIL